MLKDDFKLDDPITDSFSFKFSDYYKDLCAFE
jgi:hypothetical protein